MSNTGEATTTARDQEAQENQNSATEQATEPQAQADTTATTQQNPQSNTDSFAGQEAIHHQPGQAENNPVAAPEQATDTATAASQPKPDVSDQDYQELLPKLMSHFHNNREELARALGLHRSTVDRWLNGKSRPNNSTVLRMRRMAQERRIE
jgi:DNA-binding NtrC family response regulator